MHKFGAKGAAFFLNHIHRSNNIMRPSRTTPPASPVMPPIPGTAGSQLSSPLSVARSPSPSHGEEEKNIQQSSPPLNQQNRSHEIILSGMQDAAKKGDIDYLQKISPETLKKYVNMPGEGGFTLLHWAAGTNHLNMIEFLLKQGGNVDQLSNDKCTVLHYAALAGHNNIVDFLLKNHANLLSQTTGLGETALHMAARQWSPETVTALLEKGAAVNAVDSYGMTPLHLAVQGTDIGRVNSELVSALLNAKEIDPNLKDHEGLSAFDYATAGGQDEVAALVAEKTELDLAEKNEQGDTLLHEAVRAGLGHVVEVFLDKGADVDATNNNGLTALGIAAAEGQLHVLDALLERKENLPAEEREKLLHKLLRIAVDNGHLDLIGPLQFMGARFDEDEGLLQLLAQVNAKEGRTILHQAAAAGYPAAAAYLLDNGLDINVVDEQDRTPLELAVAGGHAEVLKVLLAKKGALGDNESKKLLQVAVEHSYGHVVDVLQRHDGIDLKPEEIDAAFSQIEKDIQEKRNKGEVEWSTLSRRVGVYTDNESGEKRGFFLLPEKGDSYGADDWLMCARGRTFITTARTPKKSEENGQSDSSTMGWSSETVFGSSIHPDRKGGMKVGKFFARLNVPVREQAVPGTNGKLRAPAQSIDLFRQLERRSFAIPAPTSKTSFPAVHRFYFDTENNLVGSECLSPAGKPTTVLKLGTKDSRAYRVNEDAHIFGNMAAFASKELKEIEKALPVGHGEIYEKKPEVSLLSFPEGSVISPFGEYGKLLAGNPLEDVTSKKPYLSVKRENGCIWVKRSPVAKKHETYSELFGTAFGNIPNIRLIKASANDKSTSSGSSSIMPGLADSELSDDISALGVMADETGTLLLTPHRHPKSVVTLEDIAVLMAQWERKGVKIKEIVLHACMAPARGEAAQADSQAVKLAKTQTWRKISGKGVSLPTMIPQEAYRNDDITAISFLNYLPPSIKTISDKVDSYSTSNNPSINDPDPDPEWELAFPDGTFHEASDENMAMAQGFGQLVPQS